jgi:hypothetical protein
MIVWDSSFDSNEQFYYWNIQSFTYDSGYAPEHTGAKGDSQHCQKSR